MQAIQDTVWYPWLVIGVTLVLCVSLTVWLCRSLRHRSYQHWSRPARWSFFTGVTLLAVMGAVLWITLQYERNVAGGITAFVGIATAFWYQVIAPWRARGSVATPSPRPTA